MGDLYHAGDIAAGLGLLSGLAAAGCGHLSGRVQAHDLACRAAADSLQLDGVPAGHGAASARDAAALAHLGGTLRTVHAAWPTAGRSARGAGSSSGADSSQLTGEFVILPHCSHLTLVCDPFYNPRGACAPRRRIPYGAIARETAGDAGVREREPGRELYHQ